MKKKVLSILLTAAMVMSMAVGCGSNKSASTDAKDDTKTEASADGESNQILFNGSSTLAPVITSIATNFFDTYGTWKAYDSSLPDEDIAIYVSAGGSGQGTKAVIDGTSTFGMVARSVKDEEYEPDGVRSKRIQLERRQRMVILPPQQMVRVALTLLFRQTAMQLMYWMRRVTESTLPRRSQ